MGPLVAILTLVLVALVVLLVSAPLRRRAGEGHADAAAGRGVDDRDGGASPERDELEAAREAKYREIRDCELDFRTGKLSREDYEATDAQLRGEAIAILDRLERLDRGES